MIGVVDRDQRVDACVARGLQLGALKLPLVGWKHAEIDALQADRWLFQIDQFHAGYGLQNLDRGLHNARNAAVLVQRYP